VRRLRFATFPYQLIFVEDDEERFVVALSHYRLLQVAHEERALVRVPAPVLAEVCRGGPVDAPIHHALNGRGIVVAPLTAEIARRAGALLARVKFGAAHAVDAFVVSTAIEFGTAVIATGNPADLRRLASAWPQMRVIGI
jgi:hypothetical protein